MLPGWVAADTCQPSLTGKHANLKPAVADAVITGNVDADTRIRQLAESRGYQLQVQLADKDDLTFPWSVHRCVVTAWERLRKTAAAAGFELGIVSGYRSLAKQRQIFLSKLYQRGVSAESIARGEADDSLQAILDYSAPPGYSRHHSGFTVDIQSDNSGLNAFGATDAYRWISADNFRVARAFGFVPSYPDELPDQGPLPEPWEFIWVGDVENLVNSPVAPNRFLESARRIVVALDSAADDARKPRAAQRAENDSVDALPGG